MTAHNPSQVSVTGYLEGEQMRGYITDMVIAQAYAEYNHIMRSEEHTSELQSPR